MRRRRHTRLAGGTAAEELNNAIIALDFAMPAEPPGRKQAVADLAVHWLEYWTGGRSWSPLADAGKVQRYAEWYARAWTLAPAATRALVPDPRSLDVSNGRAIAEQIRITGESLQAAGNTIESVAKDIGKGIASATWAPAAIAVAVLLAIGWAKR